MTALVFPGQGSQFEGMGKDLYFENEQAKYMFDEANEILGYRLTDIMFEGSAEDLKKTKVTQPAIFLHSVILLKCSAQNFDVQAVAGHSLGEITALVANECLSWQDALKLVQTRALAMQKACELKEGTMAAVIGLEDNIIEEICNRVKDIVVPANYNCPGQVVISGSVRGVDMASEKLKEAGARRVLPLQVGGAFHSPLMLPAKEELESSIHELTFRQTSCPIYQNIDGSAETNIESIKSKLIRQLVSPVKWTQTMKQMMSDGLNEYVEVGGTGKILSGLFKRLDRNIFTISLVK